MKTEVIKKEDIPEWEYGDVMLKRFSFGDKIQLANMAQSISLNKDGVKVKNNEMLDVYKMTTFSLAAGIHAVKKPDNYEWLIPPHSHIDDKLVFVQNDELSPESGGFLLNKVKEINKELTEELKKKSSEQSITPNKETETQ